MKHIIFSLIVLLLFVSCSTRGNKSSNESQEKLNNNPNISLEHNQNVYLQVQISNLDAQLLHLDAMINSARARKIMNPIDPANIDNQTIENEIMGYEAQKTDILNQKNILQAQLK